MDAIPSTHAFCIIAADPAACTGCMRCSLACSDMITKTFAPSRARIHVQCNGVDDAIRFDDECTGCGVCVEHCFFGALRKHPKGAT